MKTKIEIIENFFTDEECNNLIDYHKRNHFLQTKHPVNRDKHIRDVDITICKKFSHLLEKLNVHVLEQGCQVEYTKICKWTDDCSQSLHLDDSSPNTIYSSILYLNDGYFGGQTFFEDGLMVRPIKGRGLFFNGMWYKHGVMPIKKGPRYTLATWYKRK